MHGRNFLGRCLQVNQHGAILGMQMHRNRAFSTPSLGESFINDSGASRRGAPAVVASAAKQSMLSFFARRDGLLRFARNDGCCFMDCFAEPVIGRAFARPVGSQ